jgi:UDP-glucose 4-epimerase
VVDELQAGGIECSGLDNRPSKWTNIGGDVRNLEDCEKAVANCESVVHLAAKVSVDESVRQPRETVEHNVTGTMMALEAARKADVRRFLFASSAAVYGSSPAIPTPEASILSPQNPYAASKMAGEAFVAAFGVQYGISTLTIRPFNVYSPRQDASNPYSGVIAAFCRRAASRLPPIVHGGWQTRDFVHAEDVARWIVHLAEPKSKVVGAINLASGVETTVLDLANLVARGFGLTGAPTFEAPRPNDILRSVGDTKRMRSVGLRPGRPLEAGLADFSR